MARTRPFAAYPPSYSAAVRKVVQKGKTLMLPFEDRSKAMRWRGQFYAFLNAVKLGAEEPAASDTMKELRALAVQVMLSVEEVGGKVNIRIQHRDRSWQADIMRNAVELDEGPLPEVPAVPLDLVPGWINLDGTAPMAKGERAEARDGDDNPLGKSEKSKYY